MSQASPIEQWAYFLLNAETMTLDEVRRLFPDIEFSEAAGVLEMISKNPEQRQLYDARLKFQRDEAARLEAARIEGIEKGRDEGLREGIGIEKGIEKGEIFGCITTLQGLLGLVESSRDELSRYNEDQLSDLVEQLKHQLRTAPRDCELAVFHRRQTGQPVSLKMTGVLCSARNERTSPNVVV